MSTTISHPSKQKETTPTQQIHLLVHSNKNQYKMLVYIANGVTCDAKHGALLNGLPTKLRCLCKYNTVSAKATQKIPLLLNSIH